MHHTNIIIFYLFFKSDGKVVRNPSQVEIRDDRKLINSRINMTI